MPSPSPSTIAIIGAGPCGLTLARLLECKGITDYLVFERDVSRTNRTIIGSSSSASDSAHHAGGSLDLHPSTGQLAIRECGLFDEFTKHARWDDGIMGFRDSSDASKLIEDLGAERDLPEIDRGILRDMLLDSIPEGKIRWGHGLKRVSSGEEDDAAPFLEFTNGVKLSKGKDFRLVVGADGAWSKVRPLLTPQNPEYQGMHYIESRILPSSPAFPLANRLFGTGTHLSIRSLPSPSSSSSAASAVGKGFIIQRQGGEDRHWRIYLCISTPNPDFGRNLNLSPSNLQETRDFFLSSPDLFGGEEVGEAEEGGGCCWSPEYREMISHSTDFRSWALYHHQYQHKPAAGKIWDQVPGFTLAGDAAHTSTPFAGEGVNCAMTDALELAGKIASVASVSSSSSEGDEENFDKAIRSYEVDMFRRGVELIEKSKGNGEMIWDDGGLEVVGPRVRAVFG